MTTTSPNVARALAAAIRKAPLPVEEKALLRELAASYHAASGGASPSMKNLVLWTGLDEASLKAVRFDLKERGLLDWEVRKDAAGKPQTTMYRLNLEAIEKLGSGI